jgi:hypothetical protein
MTALEQAPTSSQRDRASRFERGHEPTVVVTDLEDSGAAMLMQAQLLVDIAKGVDDRPLVGLSGDQGHHVVAQRFSLVGSWGTCGRLCRHPAGAAVPRGT